SVLITSRITDWPTGYARVPVDELPLPKAREFLTERTRELPDCASDPDGAERLAKELGCLPLALEQAAAYIIKRKISFEEYLKRCAQTTVPPMEENAGGGTKYKRSVAKTWLVTMDRLSPIARTVLRLSAFVAPDDIPRAMFTEGKET